MAHLSAATLTAAPRCGRAAPPFAPRSLRAARSQIGNSPTMIAKAQLAELLPRWDRYVRAIHNDTAADKALGWAQEMYGFALALANSPAGVPAVQYRPAWMVQPPFQQTLQVDTCAVRHRCLARVACRRC